MIKQMEKLYVELDKEKNRSYEVQCRFEDMEGRLQQLEGEKVLIEKEYESLLQEYKKS